MLTIAEIIRMMDTKIHPLYKHVAKPRIDRRAVLRNDAPRQIPSYEEFFTTLISQPVDFVVLLGLDL